MPSGRYPKIWDQPAVQRLQQSTGALIVPTHLREWGSAPTDKPEMRYKKGQWNLVSPGLYLHALLLARRCQGKHRHMDVKGESDIPGVPRTRRAQVYPARLCARGASGICWLGHYAGGTSLGGHSRGRWPRRGTSIQGEGGEARHPLHFRYFLLFIHSIAR